MAAVLLSLTACSSIPDPHFEKHEFPSDAYVGDLKDRPYTALGLVRGRTDYITLDPGRDEGDLCRNYYNKAVRELLKNAKAKGADAVIDVKSVVFYDDGRSTTYPTPECSDDGEGGQVLVQGIAVTWKKPTPLRSDSPEFPTAMAAVPVVAPSPPPVSANVITPSSDKYKGLQLKIAQDGMDGGIRIVSKPTRVVLFTNDRKILDDQSIEARRSWLGFEFFTSPSQRNILLNRDQNGEISAEVLDLRSGKLEVVGATDATSKLAEPLELKSGPHSAWKMTHAKVHDILQIVSQPDSKEITFIRYHNVGGTWMKTMRAEQGAWDASSSSFPGDDKFPPPGTAAL